MLRWVELGKGLGVNPTGWIRVRVRVRKGLAVGLGLGLRRLTDVEVGVVKRGSGGQQRHLCVSAGAMAVAHIIMHDC